jgi:hypothetical protein
MPGPVRVPGIVNLHPLMTASTAHAVNNIAIPDHLRWHGAFRFHRERKGSDPAGMFLLMAGCPARSCFVLASLKPFDLPVIEPVILLLVRSRSVSSYGGARSTDSRSLAQDRTACDFLQFRFVSSSGVKFGEGSEFAKFVEGGAGGFRWGGMLSSR